MDENNRTGTGKRQAPRRGMSRGGKIAIGVTTGVAALLLGSYLGICAYANGRIAPRTQVAGVDVGGMTPAQAAQELGSVRDLYQDLTIPITVGDRTVELSAREVGLRPDVSAALEQVAPKGGFLAAGGRFLAGLMGGGAQVDAAATVTDSAAMDRVLDQVQAGVSQPVEENAWIVDEEANLLTLTRGRTGQSVDREALRREALASLAAGRRDPIAAQIITAAPAELDFPAIAALLGREPINATLNPETFEVEPHITGLALDVTVAKAVFDSMGEGETRTVELMATEPPITTADLQAVLFRDILGEAKSKVTGDANRVGNVRLAAAACNGKIILPGEQMSYNKTTGQRTVEKGYREASGYTAKGVVDMVGGGVCQPSSTLYHACLRADLEIVSRKNHMYVVSYMPYGMDATVSWPDLDYVFANNTDYPIRVDMTMENGYLNVRIYGTKTTEGHVEPRNVVLSTTPAGVDYQADETLPRGTTKVIQPAHTGMKVEVYKDYFDAAGNLLKSELISTDTYRSSKKIIGYNPYDGVEGAVDPIPDPNAPAQPSPDPGTGTPPDAPGTGKPPDGPGTGTPPNDPGAGTPPDGPGTGTPPDGPGTGTPPDGPGGGTPPDDPGPGRPELGIPTGPNPPAPPSDPGEEPEA